MIDSMAILHRAYHALPPLTTKRGEPINAVYGLVSMLLRIIQDLKPTHIIACFDRKEPTFRQKEFKAYQAQRPETAKELGSQFDKAKDFFKAAGIPTYSMAGFEADDVIGTIAKQSTEISNFQFQISNKKGKYTGEKHRTPHTDHQPLIDEVIIITGDRDILQLVDDKKGIKLYMPIVGLSNAKLFGEKETFERMGVKPELIPDLKGLVGDPSDNYKGVAGIGPKTASDLLTRFGTLSKIYEHLNDISEPIREKLEKGKDDANLSYKLATIIKDVPIEFNLDGAAKWKINSDRILSLFEDYGFKTLTKRIKEVGKIIVSENQMKLI